MRSKLANRLSIAASYFRHKAVLNGGPVEVTIESTARCNLYCPMCPRHIYTFDNENMDMELYRQIVRDCKDYVEFIWPYGIGEPLIHPNIFEMIRTTKDAGIRTGLSTNATLLDEKRADLLLDSGIDYLILAFDGASSETYEKYRAGAVFGRTRENILGFLEKKIACRSSVYVVLQMVLLKDNIQEIDAYRKLWNVAGVDDVRFKRDEIRIEGSMLPDARPRSQRRHPCHLLWRGPMYIRYDGRAYPCCYMYDEAPVGDLTKQSMMEVWNSSRMVRLREAHLNGDLSAYDVCRTCQAARPGPAAFYGSLAFDSLTVRKAVPLMEKLARSYKVGVFEED